MKHLIVAIGAIAIAAITTAQGLNTSTWEFWAILTTYALVTALM